MTSQYIITEKEIDDLAFGQCCDFELIVSTIRSRPYNPQAERVGIDGLTDSEYEHAKLVQEIEILHDRLQTGRETTINEFYLRLKVERDPIFDGVSWDDVEAVFIKLREGKDGE